MTRLRIPILKPSIAQHQDHQGEDQRQLTPTMRSQLPSRTHSLSQPAKRPPASHRHPIRSSSLLPCCIPGAAQQKPSAKDGQDMTSKDRVTALTEQSVEHGTLQNGANILTPPQLQLKQLIFELNAYCTAKSMKPDSRLSLRRTRKRTHTNATTSQQPKHSTNGLTTKLIPKLGH